MVEFTQMRTLVLVADTGNLAKAARQLDISAVAVSKQLTKLEEELQVKLLHRTTRKVELTELGSKYCDQCRRILEEVKESQGLISEAKTVPEGILKVVSGRHFGIANIIPHMKEFLKRYPDIILDLELAERIPDFESESIDVVIGMSLSMRMNAIQKRIASTHYTFCASPDYLKAFGPVKKPEDLVKHRYLTHSMRRPDDQLHFGSKTIRLKPFCRINDAEALMQLAIQGLGIVKLHDYVVREAIRKKQLVELLPSYIEKGIPLYVAYPERRFVPAKVRCFIDFIEAKL